MDFDRRDAKVESEMLMSFRYLMTVILFAILSMTGPAWSHSLVHLGGAPRGLSLIEAKSVNSEAPVIISGTLVPPTLWVNGQKVQLQNKESSGELGLWINGKQYTTKDEAGRFFVQLLGDETAV